MIIKSAEFVLSAVKPEHYPVYKFPEFAFAGRSNVGKSSLINTLVNRKRLVKTSSTPGRTQLINFFLINEIIGLVDLPGYGYAKVPESVRKNWGPMIETYLKTRENLKAVILIMDIRRIPDHKDHDFLAWLTDFHVPVIPVLTKADKLKKSKLEQQLSANAHALGMNRDKIILFSSKDGTGREKVWSAINDFLAGKPAAEGEIT
jgi:GTP-binding protein